MHDVKGRRTAPAVGAAAFETSLLWKRKKRLMKMMLMAKKSEWQGRQQSRKKTCCGCFLNAKEQKKEHRQKR